MKADEGVYLPNPILVRPRQPSMRDVLALRCADQAVEIAALRAEVRRLRGQLERKVECAIVEAKRCLGS